MSQKNVIQQRSYSFALQIIRLYKELARNKDAVLARQLLRSGTSVGANVEEAEGAQSKKDFVAKLSIAYKEARETSYWLKLIRDSESCDNVIVLELIDEADQLRSILAKIILTTKNNF